MASLSSCSTPLHNGFVRCAWGRDRDGKRTRTRAAVGKMGQRAKMGVIPGSSWAPGGTRGGRHKKDKKNDPRGVAPGGFPPPLPNFSSSPQICILRSMAKVLSNVTLYPSSWSPCQSSPNLGLGGLQTRYITLCDPHGCTNVTRFNNTQNMFHLVQGCEISESLPVWALVFVSCMILLIVFGCMCMCGCCRSNRVTSRF